MSNDPNNIEKDNWQEMVDPYQTSCWKSSVWQLVNTLVPYFALWFLMFHSLKISYWLTLGLAVVAGGFLVRVFIIFHDCGHGSFFKTKKLNDIVGFLTGILVFTPYAAWRHEHAKHHATAGNLDDRGIGDIWTMTVKEYEQSTAGKKILYRLARNPFILFIIGPIFLFLVRHRFALGHTRKKEKDSVFWTNVALMALALLVSLAIGFKNFLLIQIPVLVFAASIGVWIFYVQHQFEGVYWERQKDWDYVSEALYGSSFYKLPKLLQWFTGNIGYHHIHHLSPRIPNYKLERCHLDNPLFQKIKPVTLWSSLKSFRFRLWDEQQKKLVGFKKRKQGQRRERELSS